MRLTCDLADKSAPTSQPTTAIKVRLLILEPFIMNVSQQTLAASASDPKIGALELQKIHQQLHYQSDALHQVEDVLVAPEHHVPFTRLMKHFGVDFVSAIAASFAVSPFITVVDRAIAENASGRRTLSNGVKELARSFVERPVQFCRSREFMWIFGLYSATYATANTCDSYYEWKEADGQMPKLLATTAVNMSLVIAKDRAFAQMFSVTKQHKFPVTSVGLFAIRDSLTVISCFHAPKVIMEHLRERGVNDKLATGIAQIGAPVAVQFASTPLHLLGLDLYNHPVADRAARLQFIQREYFRSSLARIARIGPAFGIGGIGNTSCRTKLRAMVDN